MAPGMPIPSWTRSRNGSSSVALSRNVGPAGDGRSVGSNRPRSWMACGRRCAVAGPTVQRTGTRSFPIASASSVSRAVVVVRHAKRCSHTGIPVVWSSASRKDALTPEFYSGLRRPPPQERPRPESPAESDQCRPGPERGFADRSACCPAAGPRRQRRAAGCKDTPRRGTGEAGQVA